MKRLLLISVAALLLMSCSTNQFKIEGNIENATDQMVFLRTMQDNELVTIDSTMMKGGKFNLKGSVEVPDIYAIDFDIQDERIIVFIENSKITVTGTADDIMGSTIKGSATHDLLLDFNLLQEEISQVLMEIQFQYQSAAMDGTLTPVLDEELRKEYMAEKDKMVQSIKEFAINNAHSVVSAYITITQFANELSTDELESIVSKFTKDIQASPFVKSLNEKLNLDKLTAVGEPFIDFIHPNQDGELITFSAFTGENYILLDFWAGWCVPCRRENPHLVKLYNKYHDKGFDIFGVSLDRSREEWLNAIKADGLPWPQVSDITGWENPVAKMYGIQSIPANLLISPEGKIIAKNLGASDLEIKLAEIFN